MSVAWVAVGVAVAGAASQAKANKDAKDDNARTNAAHQAGYSSTTRPSMYEATLNPMLYMLSETMRDYSRGAHTAEAQGWKAGNDGKWYDRKGNVVKNPGSTAWQTYGEFRRKQMNFDRVETAAAGAYNSAQPTWNEQTQQWSPGDQQAFVDPELWNSIGGNGRMQLSGNYNLDQNGVFIGSAPIETPQPEQPQIAHQQAVTQAPQMAQPQQNAFDPYAGQDVQVGTTDAARATQGSSMAFTGYGVG